MLTPKDPTRFGSLAEMQDCHGALVKEVGTDVLAPGNPARVAEFVRRGVATGAVLDAKEDRAAAQALVNFWAARLTSAARAAERKRAEELATVRWGGVSAAGVGNGGRESETGVHPPAEETAAQGDESEGTASIASAVPELGDTLLLEFDRATMRTAAAAADAWLATLPETDRVTARRVMLRLVRLLPDGGKFDPVPTVRATLYDLDAPDRLNAVVDGLAAAGVVRVTRADLPDLDRVALRFPELTTQWAPYAAWLADRRRFREAVLAWDRAGRPHGSLATGAQLQEALFYFDRDNLERQFIEHSRHQRWREHERNRKLKWVFGSLALVALVGWIVAGISYYRAREDARAANLAEAKEAKANTALSGKQQLTNIRLLIRGLGELAAAHTRPSREIAEARAHALIEEFGKERTREFDNSPQAAPFQNLLSALQKYKKAEDEQRPLTENEIAEIYRFRNPFLGNRQLDRIFKDMQKISFAMVTISAQKAVDELKIDKPYSEVEPYVREFWTQYWGEMLLVEGPSVATAMVKFGQVLEKIQAEAESLDSSTGKDQLKAVAAQCPGKKGKQLAPHFTNLRLNAASFAKLDAYAKKLDISPRDWGPIQESLSKLRKEAISRPVTNRRLVTALEKSLPPLLKALKAEKGKVQRYPDADR